MIEPRMDAYGKEADGSALADYVELLALADESLSVADLADIIKDNNWKVRSRELIHIPQNEVRDPDEEPSEDVVEGGLIEEPSLETARWVFELLAERQELLGELYPFEVEGVRLNLRGGCAGPGPYLSLLAISIAHAYEVERVPNPRVTFERVVARALAARGVATVDMANCRRGQPDFVTALRLAADVVGLDASPNAAPYRNAAQEAGVDTLSHMSWGDLRPGHWIFIGQATCGKTETWPAKIGEPAPGVWGPWLGSLVSPLPYLAVPHHAEEHHLEELTTAHRVLILDRLRICRFAGDPESDEEDIIGRVLDEDVVRL